MSVATQVHMLKHWTRYLAKFHLGFAVAVADRKMTMGEVIFVVERQPQPFFEPPDEDDWCGTARPDFKDRGGRS